MRTLARIHLLAILAVCSIIIVIRYAASSDRIAARLHKTLAPQQRRLVVFGDFHSDNSESGSTDPEFRSGYIRDVAQGLPWTTLLGQELLFDRVDNFARSYPLDSRGIQTAALVDNELLGNLTRKNNTGPIFSPLPDFRSQVEHWVEFEKDQRANSNSEYELESTLFTIFFGTWDIWEVTDKDYADPMFAVQESILYLFDQIDIIAENWPQPPTILLLNMFDLTFTPRYQRQRVDNPASRSLYDAHRQTISLVKEWNSFLRHEAQEWPKGHLIMFDLDKWLIGQLRQAQLYDYHYRDMEKDIAQLPVFNETMKPCQALERMGEMKSSDGRCENPALYLFWDDMQFGPTAHTLIAKEVAQLVYANTTLNTAARLRMLVQQNLTETEKLNVAPPSDSAPMRKPGRSAHKSGQRISAPVS